MMAAQWMDYERAGNNFTSALARLRRTQLVTAPSGSYLPFCCASCAFILSYSFGLLVERAEDFSPFVVGILRWGPDAGSGLPRFEPALRVLDGDLIGEVVLRGAGPALDDVLLIAVQPAAGSLATDVPQSSSRAVTSRPAYLPPNERSRR